MANYSCKKFTPTSHLLTTIHLLQEDRQMMDDNSCQ